MLAHKTIANILKQHGIEPAPERSQKTTWKEFLSRHFDQTVASDFFTVEVWTPKGLTRFVVLFFIELSTRRVEVGGIASQANGPWMVQIARNLTEFGPPDRRDAVALGEICGRSRGMQGYAEEWLGLKLFEIPCQPFVVQIQPLAGKGNERPSHRARVPSLPAGLETHPTVRPSFPELAASSPITYLGSFPSLPFSAFSALAGVPDSG